MGVMSRDNQLVRFSDGLTHWCTSDIHVERGVSLRRLLARCTNRPHSDVERVSPDPAPTCFKCTLLGPWHVPRGGD